MWGRLLDKSIIAGGNQAQISRLLTQAVVHVPTYLWEEERRSQPQPQFVPLTTPFSSLGNFQSTFYISQTNRLNRPDRIVDKFVRSTTSSTSSSSSSTSSSSPSPNSSLTSSSSSSLSSSSSSRRSSFSSTSSANSVDEFDQNDEEIYYDNSTQEPLLNAPSYFFEMKNQIGEGGYGRVYHVKSLLNGEIYAVKVIPISLHKSISIKKNDSESRFNNRTLREVICLSQVTNHINIVQFYGSWLEPSNMSAVKNWEKEEEEESSYSVSESRSSSSSLSSLNDSNCNSNNTVTKLKSKSKSSGSLNEEPVEYLLIQMEFCKGGTLKEWIEFNIKPQNQPNFNNNISTKIFYQLLSAVSHVHSCGWIHCDITPQNIFIAGKFLNSNNETIPVLKLGDFGLARPEVCSFFTPNLKTQNSNSSQVSTETSDGLNPGTFLYASPEVSNGGEITKKSDVYSLGVLFFELFYPFSTKMERAVVLSDIKNGNFPDRNEMNRYFSSEMIYLLEQMLSTNLETRPNVSEIMKNPIFFSCLEE
eukprot:c19690_g1_i1.p2 GENE.c19690_g1_i1~~c19690_g1_i1.p2  ORF type:complete len:531 (-),score=207.45 c19690_g1_i1:144-1736(-)